MVDEKTTLLIDVQVSANEALKRQQELKTALEAEKLILKEIEQQEGKVSQAYIAQESTVKQLNSQLAANQRVLTSMAGTSTEVAGAYAILNQRSAEAAQRASDIGAAYGRTSTEFKEASSKAKLLSDELIAIDADINKHTRSVGNYTNATKNLGMQYNQIFRELPNAGISLQTFIMSLSNNLTMFGEAIGDVKKQHQSMMAEFEAGKADKPQSFFKMLTSAINPVSLALSAGVMILTMYGKEIATWIGNLFSAEKALKATTEAQLGLNTSTQVMVSAMKSSGNEYGKAVENIEKISLSLKSAVGNTNAEKHALIEYNSTLGVTFGKANDVDSALKLIAKNKDSYISAMKQMAFANAFFAESASDAVKKVKIQSETNAEVLGESSKKYIEDIEAKNKRLRQISSQRGGFNPLTGEEYETSEIKLKQYNQSVKAYNDAAEKERARQIALIDNHQKKIEAGAEKHFKASLEISKKNNFGYADVEKANENASKQSEKELKLAKKTAAEKFAILQKELELKKELDQKFQDLKIKQGDKEIESAQEVIDRINQEKKKAQSEDPAMKGYLEKTNTELQRQQDARAMMLQADYDLRMTSMATMYDAQRDAAEREYQLKIEAATRLGVDTTDITALYEKKKTEIATAEENARLELMSGFAGNLATIFGKSTKVGKAAASAQIAIDTYKGAMSAFASFQSIPPPFGQILGAAAAGAVVAKGASSIKDVWNVKSGLPGDSSGGSSSLSSSGTGSASIVASGLVARNSGTTQQAATAQAIDSALKSNPVQPVLVVPDLTKVQTQMVQLKSDNSL